MDTLNEGSLRHFDGRFPSKSSEVVDGEVEMQNELDSLATAFSTVAVFSF